MKSLIIAEKPSVAGDIAAALGGMRRNADGDWERDDIVVSHALGHLVGITAPEAIARQTPVIPDVFDLVALPKSESQLKHVVKAIRRPDVDVLINACDAGREGEYIFRLIVRYAKSTKTVKRMWLQSMTPGAIRDGFKHLRSDREMAPLAAAAAARSEADWIVGINGSRSCKRLTGETTPVGRVQTPTLMMVVEREEAIRTFVSRGFFEVHLAVGVAAGEFVAKWQRPAGSAESDESDPPERIWNEADAKAVVARCTAQPIAAIVDKVSPAKSSAPPLFDLTTLQREGNRLFGFSAKQTLDLAQVLYEKHKVLTYPRTDAKALPEDYVATITRTVESLRDHGYAALAAPVLEQGWIRPVKKVFDNSKISDHFAIVPTGTPPGTLSDAERKIYDLVARRLLAVFYPDAEYSVTQRIVEIGADRFGARGRVLVEAGWTAVYQAAEPEEGKGRGRSRGDDAAPGVLPVLRAGEPGENRGLTPVAGKTRPPAQFNEAALLSAMEHAGRQVDDDAWREAMAERGLGTPATRAATIEGLIADGYLTREKKLLVPTERAFVLKALLQRLEAQALLSPALTGEWEAQLKAIEAQQLDPVVFRGGIERFTRELVARAGTMDAAALADAPPCPACEKPLRRIKGPKGFFWGCTGYPDCSTTLPDVDGKPGARQPAQAAVDGSPGPTYPCPLCGKPMRRRDAGRGPFWGCSGFPTCKHTLPDVDGKPGERSAAPSPAPTAGSAPKAAKPATGTPGQPCPDCGKGTLQTRSLKGRPFVGCSAFPSCKYFKWSS
uniref:DNA topoisomerase n=1 Tax=Burkholderia arboris TaxID=488730 RepID=UPI003BEEC7B3